MNRFLIGLVLLAWGAPQLGVAADRCGGGDGPKPFSDVSATLPYRVKPLDTNGGVKEFIHWDSSNTVVYRNSRNEIRGLRESAKGDSHFHYASAQTPIDRTVDPKESSILLEGMGWIYERLSSHWIWFTNRVPMHHLFWNSNNLYSFSTAKTVKGTRYEIYRYQRGSSSSANICNFTPIEGVELKLGHGHRFPEMILYSSRPSIEGEDITIYELDVEKCRVATLERKVPGPALNVFRFKGLRSYAVQVDHPRSNLLWWTPTGCDYYDIDARTPFVLNYEQPVVATWNPNQDISLFFLSHASKAKLLTGLPIRSLTANDLWMSSNGHDVYISPLFEGEKYKWLLKVDLNSPRI